MNQFSLLATSVKMETHHTKLKLVSYSPDLSLVGEGRSAYVFKIKDTSLALKVFFPNHEATALEEASIYQRIQHLSYYPTLHASGENYLVIDFIEGLTLFQCLERGMLITDWEIKEIDHALQLARSEGLNPSDIHLKNIFITPDRNIVIIDVARFRQSKKCRQWHDLRESFYKLYKRAYFPKKIPAKILNLISSIYKTDLVTKGLNKMQ